MLVAAGSGLRGLTVAGKGLRRNAVTAIAHHRRHDRGVARGVRERLSLAGRCGVRVPGRRRRGAAGPLCRRLALESLENRIVLSAPPAVCFAPEQPYAYYRTAHGGANGTQADDPADELLFMNNMFGPGASWATAAAHVNTFEMPAYWVTTAPAADVHQAVSWLHVHNIQFAVAVGTVYQGNSNGEGTSPPGDITSLVQDLQKADVAPDWLDFDEPFFFAYCKSHVPLSTVIANSAWVYQQFASAFPGIQVSDAEPVNNDAQDDVNWLPDLNTFFDGFQSATGTAISHFNDDLTWDSLYSGSLSYISQFSQLHVPYGIYLTGMNYGSGTSSAAWMAQAESNIDAYEAAGAAPPVALVSGNWGTLVQDNAPDNQLSSLTYLVNYYFNTPPAGTPTLAPAVTTTTLSASAASIYYGQSVTLTATLTATAGADTPTGGAVSFFNGGTLLGSAALNDGTATLALTTLPLGADSLTASYSGTVQGTTYYAPSDPMAASSTATAVTVTVVAPATTTTVSTSAAASLYGQPITVTASVTSAYGTPSSGSVTFWDGATSLGNAALGSGAAASVTVSSLAVGTHELSASYSGDGGSFPASTSLAGGAVTTVGGSGSTVTSAGDNGPATLAALNTPVAVAVDGSGDVYIADSSGGRIRKIDPSGVISTVAGGGGYPRDNVSALVTQLNNPQGVAVNSTGTTLYIADTGDHRVRSVNLATGVITNFAGNGTSGYSGDGGAATSALLTTPVAVALDPTGQYLYICDQGANCIRRVTLSTGKIYTYAGTGTAGSSGDGGPATAATLDAPTSIALDAAGDLFISDTGNARIRGGNGRQPDDLHVCLLPLRQPGLRCGRRSVRCRQQQRPHPGNPGGGAADRAHLRRRRQQRSGRRGVRHRGGPGHAQRDRRRRQRQPVLLRFLRPRVEDRHLAGHVDLHRRRRSQCGRRRPGDGRVGVQSDVHGRRRPRRYFYQRQQSGPRDQRGDRRHHNHRRNGHRRFQRRRRIGRGGRAQYPAGPGLRCQRQLVHRRHGQQPHSRGAPGNRQCGLWHDHHGSRHGHGGVQRRWGCRLGRRALDAPRDLAFNAAAAPARTWPTPATTASG